MRRGCGTCGLALVAGVLLFSTTISESAFGFQQPGAAAARETSVSVAQFGAVGDGVHDDTGAFEAALAAAATPPQGTRPPVAGARVDVPPGKYVLKRPLALHNVLLTGLAAGGWPADADAMPVLILDHNGVGLSLYDAASVNGLTLRRTAASNAHSDSGTRQATIELARPGNTVTNVKIIDAYDGIVCTKPAPHSHNPGRLHVAQVFVVSPVDCGIDIQNTRDASLVENCQVWCPDQTHRSKFGYRFGGNDGVRCSNLFAFDCQTGFELYASQDGTSFWGTLANCGADLVNTAINIDDANYLSITGGTFLCHNHCLVMNAPAAQVTISGGIYKANGGSAVVVKNARQLSCSGIAVFRGMANGSALVDFERGGAISLTGSTIDSRAVGAAIHYDARAIGALSIVGNALTVFQTAEQNPKLRPKGIVGEIESSASAQNAVIANNAGALPRAKPPMLTFDRLGIAANHWGKFHGLATAVPSGKSDAAMVTTGFIGLRVSAVDIKNAPLGELKEQLADMPRNLSAVERQIFASNRWARKHQDANGKAYEGGWPNFEQQGSMFGVICFKAGAKTVGYQQSDIGEAGTLGDRIAKLSKWCVAQYPHGKLCLPTFESDPDGKLSAIAIRTDATASDAMVPDEELQSWLNR